MNPHAESSVFVPLRDAAIEVGRSRASTLCLLDPTVSRRHATLVRGEGGTVVVSDLDSRYGTFLNGLRIRTACASLGDRIRFGATVVYRVAMDGLELDAHAGGMRLEAREVMLSKGGRSLVRDISFAVEPNCFVGILGPSGCGKSTLLNCIASFHHPAEGTVTFDGDRNLAAEVDEYRAMLGYVPQEDAVYPRLTARENLQFAAWLRLSVVLKKAASELPVTQSLQRVGLVEHAGKRAAVLSGGQRKRLSVATELLRRPRLLLLDEPTSGLDPAAEASLMEQLRRVAKQGTTVICATHLMARLNLFDMVIVMGVIRGMGQVAYIGPPDQLLPHFDCRSFADLYDKLASGQFQPWAAGIDTALSSEPGDSDSVPAGRDAPAGVRDSEGRNAASSGRPWVNQLVSRTMVGSPWKQLLVVGCRAALLAARDRGFGGMMLAQPLVLGFLVCVTQFSAYRVAIVHFFAVVIALWLGMNNSVRDLVRERKHYLRDRLAGLRPGAYLGAKCLVYLVIGALQILLLLMVLRLGAKWSMKEVVQADLYGASWAWSMAVLLAAYSCGLGLGFLVSALVQTEEAAVAALPLLIMPQLLLSVVAAGQVNESYAKSRAFRPLVVTLTASATDLPATGRFVDAFSFLCYSRPATLMLENPRVKGYSRWIWIGDACHLLLLLLGTWIITYAAFLRAEQRWPKLLGLG